MGDDLPTNTAVKTKVSCLPVYIVIDTSQSMSPFEEVLNETIETLYGVLIASPRTSELASLSILSYNTEAEVLLQMTDLRSIDALPRLRCGGVTNFAEALRVLRERIEEDVPHLNDAGREVLRPIAFLLTDGHPTDERGYPSDNWRADYAALVDKSYRRHPRVVPFGYGSATADILNEVSTIRGAAFLAKEGSTADALRMIIFPLFGSVVASASGEELKLPTEVPGFVSLSPGAIADPEDAAEYLSFGLTQTSAGAAGSHGASEAATAARGGRFRAGDPAGSESGSKGLQARNPVGCVGDDGGSQAGVPAGAGVPPPRRRYLKGQCPESVPVGKPFSLLVSIVLAAGPASAELEPFDVPPEGRDVLLVVHAPGLRLLGDQRQTVHVPADGDSRPVMFELRADDAGPAAGVHHGLARRQLPR